jgi:hypothetical protein
VKEEQQEKPVIVVKPEHGAKAAGSTLHLSALSQTACASASASAVPMESASDSDAQMESDGACDSLPAISYLISCGVTDQVETEKPKKKTRGKAKQKPARSSARIKQQPAASEPPTSDKKRKRKQTPRKSNSAAKRARQESEVCFCHVSQSSQACVYHRTLMCL